MDGQDNHIYNSIRVFLTGITFLVFFSGAAFCKQSYDYIDITDPWFKKTPIAVPVFKAITQGLKEQKICEEASTLLCPFGKRA